MATNGPRKIDLVNAAGGVRVRLWVDDSGPGLCLFDAAGNIRALLDVTQDGSRLRLGGCLPVTLGAAAIGKKQMFAEAFDEIMRTGEVAKYAGNFPALLSRVNVVAQEMQVKMGFAKNTRADLRVTDAGYSLDLRDAAGEPQAGLDSDKNSACLNLVDAAVGSFRAVLDWEMNEMHLNLYDAEGKFHEVLGMDGAPPTVELRDTEEKVRAALVLGEDKLGLLLHDAALNLRASLDLGKDWGRLRLCNAAGKMRASLDVNKDSTSLILLDQEGRAVWPVPE